MANTWKYAFALGLVGSALAAGCVVKDGDGDDMAGASGEGGAGGAGGTAGKGGSGGSSGKGGTTGGSAGKGGTGGGAGVGGSAGSGVSGDAGMSGSDTGGASGTGGTGGTDIVVECEDLEGTTPWPDCEPVDSEDKCEVCIQTSCCEESMACYSTDPHNACGWGGPSTGDYSGIGEIGCYRQCLEEYVGMNDGICDDAGIDQCTDMCTDDCSLVPDATNEMVACMNAHCATDCFVADTESCGD